jgi:hypothetical protein
MKLKFTDTAVVKIKKNVSKIDSISNLINDCLQADEFFNKLKLKQKGDYGNLWKVLFFILKKSAEPMTAKELAEEALCCGYVSNAKNFTRIVHDCLSYSGYFIRVSKKGRRPQRFINLY